MRKVVSLRRSRDIIRANATSFVKRFIHIREGGWQGTFLHTIDFRKHLIAITTGAFLLNRH